MIQGYKKHDFSSAYFNKCPNASMGAAPADTILPEEFSSTTNFPTYVKIAGTWRLADEPRMDSCLIYDFKTDQLVTREMKHIKRNDLVVIGRTEHGQEGIYVDETPFNEGLEHCVDCGTLYFKKEETKEYCNGCNTEIGGGSAFKFMTTDVSREKEINYKEIAEKLQEQKEDGGYQIWVVGPALVHTGSAPDLSWIIDKGYVNALFSGNALGVHDIEAAIYGTALGDLKKCQDQTKQGDHSSHMRAIQEVRKHGSIEELVNQGILKTGIMHSCVTNNVPYVLTGSIRDDGPLPETITDNLLAQDAMRAHTKKATSVVMMASALHSIATGNMLPLFYVKNELINPLLTVCVDQTEFIVNKLRDRGTHQAYGVVTNAQDFVHRIKEELMHYEK